MTLTIICPNSKTYKDPLSRALKFIGINDYQILDPAHDQIEKEFCYVLYIGQIEADKLTKLKDISQMAWNLSPPDPSALEEVKRNWVNDLKKIQDYILLNKDHVTFKKSDIPNMLNLQDYLNSKRGQVVEVTLPDRRKLGIYPDNQKLKTIYDVEYHASTVVNIAKLFQLFDASEIIIKEL